MMTFEVWRVVNSRKGEIVGKRKLRGCKEEMETESRACIDRGCSVCLTQGVVSLQSGLRTIASDIPTQCALCLHPGKCLSHAVI